MKKKILYIITKGNFGGAQRYVFDLASNVSKEDFEVVVATGEGAALSEKLKKENIRTLSIPELKRDINIFSDISAFFALHSLIKKEQPNIVHLNSSKAGLLGSLAVRIINLFNLTPNTYKLKAIFTGHGWAFNEDRTVISKAILTLLHTITILLAHKTIAVSKKIAAQISQFPIIREKIILIHNGTGPVEFLERNTARAEISTSILAPLWIGTTSELHKTKSLDFLITAFASVSKTYPEAELVIIGEGHERKKLEALIKQKNLTQKVHLAGFKPDAARLLKAFDIFTLTSRSEGLPYSILEAGLAELPVIASNVGGIPEVVEQKKNGLLVEVGDIASIENSLCTLISNETERIALGKALKKNVEEKFSLKQMLDETIKLY
jgi:glycosyltransferase involved in cell wall biosynthesis